MLRMERSMSFRGKNVLVVGIGNTAADVAVDLAGVASNVYLSHRRGALVLSRFSTGAPIELSINRHTLRLMNYLEEVAPSIMSWIQDYILESAMAKSWEIDPSWNLKPSPSLTTTLPCVNERLIPCLAAGSIRSVKGLRRFLGPRSVELEDGTILEDLDSVVLATGYLNESQQHPWMKMAKPPNYDGPAIPRLFLQVFPPEYADSMAVLTSFGVTDNFWVSSELCSMAIAQLWSDKSQFPSRQRMESSIDRQKRMNVILWQRDPSTKQGVVYAREFYGFMHTAAGTGVLETLGWGLSGWKFWWKEREMARLLGWGIATPFAYRLIETGKRKAWSGAWEAMKKTNDEAGRIDKTAKRFELDKNK
jgi:dimethylaniline monooxygenase (N-oxide forming)